MGLNQILLLHLLNLTNNATLCQNSNFVVCPVWMPRAVEFVSQGLAMDMTDITNELFSDVSKISWRIKELEKLNGCKPE